MVLHSHGWSRRLLACELLAVTYFSKISFRGTWVWKHSCNYYEHLLRNEGFLDRTFVVFLNIYIIHSSRQPPSSFDYSRWYLDLWYLPYSKHILLNNNTELLSDCIGDFKNMTSYLSRELIRHQCPWLINTWQFYRWRYSSWAVLTKKYCNIKSQALVVLV